MGDASQMYSYTTDMNGQGIQVDFKKGTVMVSLVLEDYFNSGDNADVNPENAKRLAGLVASCLPDNLPYPEPIQVPTGALDEATFNRYMTRFDIGRSATTGFYATTKLARGRVVIMEFEVSTEIPDVIIAIYDEQAKAYIEKNIFKEVYAGLHREGLFVPKKNGNYILRIWTGEVLMKEIPFTVE